MKTIRVVLGVLLGIFFFVPAAGADEMGIPAATLGTGKISLRLEYNRSSNAYSSNFGGMRVASNEFFIRPSVGIIADRLEAFVKLGAVDTQVGNVFLSSGTATFNIRAGALALQGQSIDANDNMKFAWGGGLKATLLKTNRFRLGAVAYFTKNPDNQDQKRAIVNVNTVNPSLGMFPVGFQQKLETSNAWNWGLAIGPSYRFGAEPGKKGLAFTPYVGLLADWRQFDAKGSASMSAFGVSSSTSSLSFTARQDQVVGAFAGWVFDISPSFKIFSEGRLVPDGSSGIGGGFVVSF